MPKLQAMKRSKQAALVAAIDEMAKPVMTSSAREQGEILEYQALVVENDAHQRTVDVHSPAVVLNKAQVTKPV